MLHIYAQTSTVAGIILDGDDDIKIDPEVVMRLKRAKWVFPNIITFVVAAVKLRIYNAAADLIGQSGISLLGPG
jgi:hypothetical protein